MGERESKSVGSAKVRKRKEAVEGCFYELLDDYRSFLVFVCFREGDRDKKEGLSTG